MSLSTYLLTVAGWIYGLLMFLKVRRIYCILLSVAAFVPVAKYVFYACISNPLLMIIAIIFSFILDMIRRQYYMASRHEITMHTPLSRNKKGQRAIQKVKQSTKEIKIYPMRLPLFRKPEKKRIFISYSHAPTNNQIFARELYTAFSKKENLLCFLDEKDIERGSCWYRRLNQQMWNADYVISLVDAQSIKKEWPEKELEAALWLKTLSGKPTIYLYIMPGVDIDGTKSRMMDFAVEDMKNANRFVKQLSGSIDEIAEIIEKDDNMQSALFNQPL
jgi:hypothetical protein